MYEIWSKVPFKFHFEPKFSNVCRVFAIWFDVGNVVNSKLKNTLITSVFPVQNAPKVQIFKLETYRPSNWDRKYFLSNEANLFRKCNPIRILPLNHRTITSFCWKIYRHVIIVPVGRMDRHQNPYNTKRWCEHSLMLL